MRIPISCVVIRFFYLAQHKNECNLLKKDLERIETENKRLNEVIKVMYDIKKHLEDKIKC